jgi:hypothetical protein
MTYIGPITQEILNACINEFKKKENKHKFNKYILNPIMEKVSDMLFYYYLLFMIIQIVIIFMLFYSIYSSKKKL